MLTNDIPRGRVMDAERQGLIRRAGAGAGVVGAETISRSWVVPPHGHGQPSKQHSKCIRSVVSCNADSSRVTSWW